MNIMIVEDESVTAMLMSKFLKLKGHNISGLAATGEEAMELVDKEVPDIILMDIQLADKMNGIDTITEIRKKHEIPVIFLTGFPEENIKLQANKLKPIAFFTKPVMLNKLAETLKNFQ
jgi:two-component system, response regulator PdtaR